jgi:acyl carrier protein
MEALSTTGRPIEERVAAIIGDQLGVDVSTLTPDAHLLDDLGADSLDVVELVMALEEEFGIEVPDDDVENIRTVSDVVEYMAARVEDVA